MYFVDVTYDDPDHFDPRYYATALLHATQYEAPSENEGEWRYLGLVIQPDGLYLREWDLDSVTELGGVALDIPHGQWHDATIEIGGEDGTTVTVKHLRAGADETESFEAETTIPGGGRIGFGVGSEADFRFDDVGTRNDVTLTASTALRYHYDANGRVVGRTLDPGEVTEESQFFIYDGDRIIQELDESGNLVAAWDYGVYIDEILVMYRDVEAPAGLEPYYYLQDDHYNVIGLAALGLNDNQITDIQALESLPALTALFLEGNPLAAESACPTIQTLVSTGTEVDHDLHCAKS